MPRTKSNTTAPQSSATIGFESKLWLNGDKLRNYMNAAEYGHVILSLVFPEASAVCSCNQKSWSNRTAPSLATSASKRST
jgi:hypothetical protein